MAIKLQTIGVIVADMGKALAFYRTLGLPIPDGMDEEYNVDYETPQGLTLGFLTQAAARQADPGFVNPVGQGLNLQFMVDSPAEVDALYAKLEAAGYQGYVSPWDAFWGQRFARIKDADGYIVNIYAEL